MKVADSMIGIERAHDGSMDNARRSAARTVHVSQGPGEGEMQHDPRGLVVAVLMSLVCWAALGFFLLS